jgi:hypothetical protein
MKRFAALALAICLASPATAAEPIWDANKIVLKSEKLADSVFAITPNDAAAKASKGIPIATTSGFIIGEKGVLVIDTMLNKRLADQVRALIMAETNKPVRWLVNTSYHGDHSYGNYTFPKSVTIIQHAATARYVQTKFEHDTQFMMKNFGKGRGIEQAVARTGDILIPDKGSLTLDLGGQIVEIKDFGFAQTGGDLFVWHPKAKALWTGNPIISTKPALPCPGCLTVIYWRRLLRCEPSTPRLRATRKSCPDMVPSQVHRPSNGISITSSMSVMV